jgi:hypothetical protein
MRRDLTDVHRVVGRARLGKFCLQCSKHGKCASRARGLRSSRHDAGERWGQKCLAGVDPAARRPPFRYLFT